MKRTTYLNTVRPRTELNKAQKIAFGPVPVNPFKALREEHSLSVTELAQISYLSPASITKLEQGLFGVPLPSAVDYWCNKLGYPEGELTLKYENYQDSTRLRYPKLFGQSLAIDISSDQHPFRQLRSRCECLAVYLGELGTTEVARCLCLPQATLEHWEKKWHRQKSVPSAVVEVLHIINYTNREIAQFRQDYVTWREKMLVNR